MFILLIFLTFILFLITEYYFHLKFRNRVENDFPKNILIDYKEEILPQIDKGKNIPFVIYRTYYDKEIAKKFIKAKEITLKNNPNLIEKFFDDSMVDDYIKKNFSHRIYNAYNSINKDYGPARADFFRYLVIYKEGGIYLDIKSYIQNNIEKELNNDKLLVSKGSKYYYPFSYGFTQQQLNTYDWSYFSKTKDCGEYNNWHFMSPKGNEVLKKTIEHIVINIEYAKKNKDKYNNGEYSVLGLTGPILFSRVINKYRNKDNLKFYDKNFNNNISYSISDVNHKKIGYKKHYSQLKEKNIIT